MKCEHCGLIHETTCSRIKAIEYDSMGAIKRIEFHTPQPPPQPWSPALWPVGGPPHKTGVTYQAVASVAHATDGFFINR